MYEKLIWLVPLLVLASGFWRPKWAIYLFVASLPAFGSPPGGPYLAAFDSAALAVLLHGLRAPRIGASPLRWPILAVLGCGIGSLLPLAYRPPSWAPRDVFQTLLYLPGTESHQLLFTWRAALGLLLGIGLYLSCRRLLERRDISSVGLALAAGLLSVELLGLASWAGWLDLDGYRARAVAGRVHSLFFNSGWLAEFVAIAAPLAIAALWSLGRRGRVAGLGLLALSAIVLIGAHQRGGWMTAGVLAVLWGVLWFGKRIQPKIWAGVLAVALVLGASLFLLRGAAEPAPNPRLHLWKVAIELAESRPALGWGIGSFSTAFEANFPRGTPEWRRNHATAHNLYLHTTAEQGVLGLAALGLLMAALLARLVPAREAAGDAAPDLPRIGLALSIAGFFTYGLVQYTFFLSAIGWLGWVLIGLASLEESGRSHLWNDRIAKATLALALVVGGYRALVLPALDAPSNHSFGLHAEEWAEPLRFRWSDARSARRIPWSGETLVLSMANGHPQGGARPVTVRVLVDGRPMQELEIPGGWETHRLELGPPARDFVVLQLDAQPSFRPFSSFRSNPELGASSDVRRLAVAVQDPVWAPLAGRPEAPSKPGAN